MNSVKLDASFILYEIWKKLKVKHEKENFIFSQIESTCKNNLKIISFDTGF